MGWSKGTLPKTRSHVQNTDLLLILDFTISSHKENLYRKGRFSFTNN